MIGPFVGAEWVVRHRDEIVLADVRLYLDGRSGRDAYESAHIPGAAYVELADVLAEPASDAEGRHPLPSPERFAAGMSASGIGDGDLVVAYDDDHGVIAARLVWMLRAIGHPAALLDGGLAAWPEPLTDGRSERSLPSGVQFTPRPWPAERLAGIEDAAAGEAVLIDARDRSRYIGKAPDAIDPRSGHIPGALSVPARESVGADGRLLGDDALRQRFTAAGVDGSREVISYCGSGVTACHNLLVMEHVGLPAGRLYPGSWSQWSRDPVRPAETGDRSR